jgi:hypothetical protein
MSHQRWYIQKFESRWENHQSHYVLMPQKWLREGEEGKTGGSHRIIISFQCVTTCDIFKMLRIFDGKSSHYVLASYYPEVNQGEKSSHFFWAKPLRKFIAICPSYYAKWMWKSHRGMSKHPKVNALCPSSLQSSPKKPTVKRNGQAKIWSWKLALLGIILPGWFPNSHPQPWHGRVSSSLKYWTSTILKRGFIWLSH